MSRWTQWFRAPKGALPGGLVTKAGIGLIGVLVGGLLLSRALTGPGAQEETSGEPPRAVDDGMGRALEGRIRAETRREAQQAAARAQAARDELGRRQGRAGDGPLQSDPAAQAGSPGAPLRETSADELELLHQLRLEEVERRVRSLRSHPVARSVRGQGGSESPVPRPATSSREGATAAPEPGEAALDATLLSLEREARRLQGEIVRHESADGDASRFADAEPEPERAASPTARMTWPLDPQGWERIHEGSFLEGVLVTQLSGDFPGPVLAMVSTPLYSADRQRVLIPRGSRVIGVAEAVQHRDQRRLAVSFHRLLLHDGGGVLLRFAGLDQAGQAALSDQVDRHYLSTFAAAGAVGAISGLALAGAAPFGLRSGVGQGLGTSATSSLDRFLNRMPTITIRAGHRLRIWFTSDVLVPRPGAGDLASGPPRPQHARPQDPPSGRPSP